MADFVNKQLVCQCGVRSKQFEASVQGKVGDRAVLSVVELRDKSGFYPFVIDGEDKFFCELCATRIIHAARNLAELLGSERVQLSCLLK